MAKRRGKRPQNPGKPGQERARETSRLECPSPVRRNPVALLALRRHGGVMDSKRGKRGYRRRAKHQNRGEI